MNKTLGKLKSSAVIKQVAAGREFKGQAFLSKPAEIIFKVSNPQRDTGPYYDFK